MFINILGISHGWFPLMLIKKFFLILILGKGNETQLNIISIYFNCTNIYFNVFISDFNVFFYFNFHIKEHSNKN